mgnify:CR=1 FL=1
MAIKELKIEGMSCEHCKKAVTDALKEIDGVEQVDVDLQAGKATVSFDPERATEQQMKEAIAEAGYEVVEA